MGPPLSAVGNVRAPPIPQVPFHHRVPWTPSSSEVLLRSQECTCGSFGRAASSCWSSLLGGSMPKAPRTSMFLPTCPTPAILGEGLMRTGIWKSSPPALSQDNPEYPHTPELPRTGLKPPSAGLCLRSSLAWPLAPTPDPLPSLSSASPGRTPLINHRHMSPCPRIHPGGPFLRHSQANEQQLLQWKE